MSVTGKLIGILAIALVGLLFYLSIYVFGLYFMQFAGLLLTATMLVVILMLCAGKVEDA